MSQKQIPTLTGIVQSDDSVATANSLAMRDASGDIFANLVRKVGEVNSGYVTKSSSFTADATKSIYLCNATGGAITATLPAAASVPGLVLTFKKTDSSGNAVTLDGNASETIDGSTTLAISSQYVVKRIISDGTNWQLIGS